MKVLIIAEAGVNHNGDMGMARQLIDVASEAGADWVKFQTFSADRLVTTDTKKADYQIQTTDVAESQHAMIRRLELSREMHKALIAHCKSRSIKFFSTGFDTQSVDLLVELGLDCFKIPSGEITNLPYLRHVGRYGKPVFLSTGMSTLGEIEAALDALEQAGTSRDIVTVLHCNTEYPTPMADANLRAIVTIRDAFGVAVGYSDHTSGIEAAIAAVALGAIGAIFVGPNDTAAAATGGTVISTVSTLKICRLAARVRLRDAAMHIGIPDTLLSKFERIEGVIPARQLERLAELYGVVRTSPAPIARLVYSCLS